MQPTTVFFIWKVRDELRHYLATGSNNFRNIKLIVPEDVGKETFIKHTRKADIIAGWRLTSEQLQILAQGHGEKEY